MQASLQTHLNQPMTLDALWRTSQNHTMLWAGRDLWRSSGAQNREVTLLKTVLTSKIEPTLKPHQVAECHNQGSCNSPRTKVPQPFWWANPCTVWPLSWWKIVSHPLIKMSLGEMCVCDPSSFLCIPLKMASSSLQPPIRQLKSILKTPHAAECSGSKGDARKAISITLLYSHCTFSWTVT